MKKKYAVGTVLLITWFDAWREPLESVSPEMLGETKLVLQDIGFFIKQSNGYISIAEERTPGEEDFRHVHHIPIVNIEKIEDLGLWD